MKHPRTQRRSALNPEFWDALRVEIRRRIDTLGCTEVARLLGLSEKTLYHFVGSQPRTGTALVVRQQTLPAEAVLKACELGWVIRYGARRLTLIDEPSTQKFG